MPIYLDGHQSRILITPSFINYYTNLFLKLYCQLADSGALQTAGPLGVE
jgi:hypothetical protein